MRYNLKNIKGVKYNGKTIIKAYYNNSIVYSVSELTDSVFNSGFWSNSSLWNNNDLFKN